MPAGGRETFKEIASGRGLRGGLQEVFEAGASEMRGGGGGASFVQIESNNISAAPPVDWPEAGTAATRWRRVKSERNGNRQAPRRDKPEAARRWRKPQWVAAEKHSARKVF